ncbi:hypothetical protein CTAYLR_004835 [Chrysophaeum taylorii]|uniref:SAM-dependent MTase RsmB/NOP-type domain-containing protein n=1 Tax=Chrysophaeum taylorii TaxID=2483200 RepID=A0AAD7UEV0_9STRA|nr:hypothetical protein CTAYLR_004835 [Chrysophaeum taylorii]
MASAYGEVARALEAVEGGRGWGAVYKSRDAQRALGLVKGVRAQRPALEAALGVIGVEATSVALLATFDAVAGKGLPKRGGGALLRSLRDNLASVRAAYAARAVVPRRRRRFARVVLSLEEEEEEEEEKKLPVETSEDPHVPGLLEFEAADAKRLLPFVEAGRLVLQDKGSCFPAQALVGEAPRPPKAVLDACAAPGNKATHAASLFGGTVYALDRDPERLRVLEERASLVGAATVEPILADFLGVDPREFNDVTAILLDPSCSGGHRVSPDRLARLAKFQLMALTKALTEFPNVDRVAYSTCSSNDAENEAVVAQALQNANGAFTIAPCLRSWPRRGHPHAQIDAEALVRVDPIEDNLATPFFLALFVRAAPVPSRNNDDHPTKKKKRPREDDRRAHDDSPPPIKRPREDDRGRRSAPDPPTKQHPFVSKKKKKKKKKKKNVVVVV